MPSCSLCRASTPSSALSRVSGIAVCDPCALRDPADALRAQDIAVQWDVSPMLRRFQAGLGIPGQAPDFTLRCTPEMWARKIQKLVSRDFEVGDPLFDDAVWVQTNDVAHADRVLGQEGVQSAVLAFLAQVKTDDMARNEVQLQGATLTIATRPLGPFDDERVGNLKLETAALALHLLALGEG